MADVQSVIKDSQCDPKIYQAGNYQSIHHPVKLGHGSIIDESELDWPSAVDFPTSSSRVSNIEVCQLIYIAVAQ